MNSNKLEQGNRVEKGWASKQESGEAQYNAFPVELAQSDQAMDLAFGYRRCHDFDEGDKPGQDYAVVSCDDVFVVGVVTDGVSQSFYGHFAARWVAERLAEELWPLRRQPPGKDHLEKSLNELIAEAGPWIDDMPLPKHLPAMQRAALEKVRESAGSQAVFAAFVLNGRERTLVLYQSGDVVALVHHAQGVQLVVPEQTKGRWSSAGRSKLFLQALVFKDVKGVMLKSDGASQEWGRVFQSSSINENTFREMAENRAGVDDVSFVAAAIRHSKENPVFGRATPITPPPPPKPTPKPVRNILIEIALRGGVFVLGALLALPLAGYLISRRPGIVSWLTDGRLVSKDFNPNRMLIDAVNGRSEVVIEALLSEGKADPNFRGGKDGSTALMLLAMKDKERLVRILLDHRADADIQDKNGWTALMHASGNGNVNTVKILLSEGADPDLKNEQGNTALMIADHGARTPVIKTLLDNNADATVANEAGETVLTQAVAAGRSETVEAVLAKGVDVNQTNKSGDSLLHLAVSKGQIKVFQTLLDRKPNLDARNSAGKTPAMIAALENKTPIFRQLLERGAKLEERDCHEIWRHAVSNGHTPVLVTLSNFLVRYGMTTLLKELKGFQPNGASR